MIKGRGTDLSLPHRYQSRHSEREAPAPAAPETTCIPVQARSIIARNSSPDIPFSQSINPYQGCEHGCIYCYARPTHAWWDLSPGLDFETRLFRKENAPALLRETLARPGYRCQAINLGANTDPYQPVEREYRLTRRILEVLSDCHHPVSVVTRSPLITRDLDLLAPMAERRLAAVAISVTTLDDTLKRRMEPRAPSGEARLRAIAALSEAGIPVTVLAAPMIPAINDHELENILAAARDAGARQAAYILLRLPHEVNPLFQHWLDEHFPQRAAHVMSLIRQCREGMENDGRFGSRMRGSGVFSELLSRRFHVALKKLGYGNEREHMALDTRQFRPPPRKGQLALF